MKTGQRITARADIIFEIGEGVTANNVDDAVRERMEHLGFECAIIVMDGLVKAQNSVV